MYNIIARQTSVASGIPAPALEKPAAVGDKMPTFLIVSAGVADVDVVDAGGGASVGFTAKAGETWMIGPILGEDITNWGLFSFPAAADHTVTFLSAKLGVDPRSSKISVHDNPIVTPALNFVWRVISYGERVVDLP